jgi:hypothetical protein
VNVSYSFLSLVFLEQQKMTFTKNIACIAIILCGMGATCRAQENTGIFATIKVEKKHKAKGYGRRVANRSSNEKFLIPTNPLIASHEFIALSEIHHDLKNVTSFFSITVSPEGLKKLRNAVTALPDTELVLVIEDIVFGRISAKSEDDFKYNKITIVTPLHDANLEWAFQKLTEMINARKKE